ncbi:MAG: LytTR family DNA-binding domain-containing protein [Bacteroidales bacterium]
MKTKIAVIASSNVCELIKTYISRIQQYEVTYCNPDSLEAFVDLGSKRYDLLFIDPDSGPLRGFELLDSFTNKPNAVMVSTNEKHAAKAFDYEVIDYLIYPFSFHRFLKSIHRFSTLFQANPPKENTPSVNGIKVQIRANKTLYTFSEKDIYYVESMGDYIKVHTTGKTYLFKYSLHKIEKQLNPDSFMRIHRSYMVSIEKIEAMNSKFITVNNKALPIGRTYQKQTKERLQ